MLEMYELQVAATAVGIVFIVAALGLVKLGRLLWEALASEDQDDQTFGTGEED